MTKQDIPQASTVADRIAHDKVLMLEQLRKTPVTQIACEKTQIGRTTYYRWRREDQKFADDADAALSEGRLLMNDMAESQLLAAIRDGNFTAVTYWLRHHHPSYANKLELSGSVRHVDERLTPEQEAAIRAALIRAGLASDTSSIVFPSNVPHDEAKND
ncbi:MAG: hypothetical protein WCG83_02325 [Candidatus Peregrinibacteria bacterium]